MLYSPHTHTHTHTHTHVTFIFLLSFPYSETSLSSKDNVQKEMLDKILNCNECQPLVGC